MRFSVILIIAFVIVSVNAAVFQQRDVSESFKKLQDKLKEAKEEFSDFKDEIENFQPSDGINKIASAFNKLKDVKDDFVDAVFISCVSGFKSSFEEASISYDIINSFSKEIDASFKILKEKKFSEFDFNFDFLSIAKFAEDVEVLKNELIKCALTNYIEQEN